MIDPQHRQYAAAMLSLRLHRVTLAAKLMDPTPKDCSQVNDTPIYCDGSGAVLSSGSGGKRDIY